MYILLQEALWSRIYYHPELLHKGKEPQSVRLAWRPAA